MDGNTQVNSPAERAPAIAADAASAEPRTDWTINEVRELYATPFMDLLYLAQTVHRRHLNANHVQISTLLSVKTGGCPEDCGYCPQSIRYEAGVDNEPLMDLEEVLKNARAARDQGATRFCMGAAWR